MNRPDEQPDSNEQETPAEDEVGAARRGARPQEPVERAVVSPPESR